MSLSVRGRRLTFTIDVVAVAVAVVAALVPTWWLWAEQKPITRVTLERRFGPKRYSEQQEELVIRHFFNDRRNGVFVDVGSGHYMQGSNTFLLEKDLGWRGIAIDAITEYADDYARHRPASLFFPLFVSDRSDATADFYFAPYDRTRSSGVVETSNGLKNVEARKVRTATLDDLLGANSVTRFDFLSMDIELGEPAALAGLTIERYRPSLVCIEAHEEVRDRVAAYFKAHHYRRLAEYDVVDSRNWYFTPE